MSNVNNTPSSPARSRSPGKRQQNKGLSLFKKMDTAMKAKFESVQSAMSNLQELNAVNEGLKKELARSEKIHQTLMEGLAKHKANDAGGFFIYDQVELDAAFRQYQSKVMQTLDGANKRLSENINASMGAPSIVKRQEFELG